MPSVAKPRELLVFFDPSVACLHADDEVTGRQKTLPQGDTEIIFIPT
jgi:hypothetical protein